MIGDAQQSSGDDRANALVPLAIVGIGCTFPEAEDLDAYWNNIVTGRDSITDVPDTHWNPDDYFDADPKSPDRTYAKRGGFLPPFDFSPLEFGIAPNALEATDTAQLLALVAAQRALQDAGYGRGARTFDRERASVILGVTGTLELAISLGARLGHPRWRRALEDAGVDKATADEVVERIAGSYVGWQEASFPGLLGNVVAGRIANRLDLGGTNCVVDAACASALSALHLAALELQTGRSDMVLTGGVDTFNDIFMYMCFSKTPALSPTGTARPFDKQGDGTILGEGVGILALKRLDDAVRDGDHVYAEIRGIGSSSDGKGNAIYAPCSDGQAKAVRRAYAEARIGPETIELVEAHGTGTIVGDAVEVAALAGLYREARAEGSWCALGSVKSQIGHTKAAAGVAGLIKTALALDHKVLPPTIKVTDPIDMVAPGASPFYVNTTQRPWLGSQQHPRRAALSSFGFGGSNFHCVLQEHGDARRSVDWDRRTLLFAYSGETAEAISGMLPDGESSWNDWRKLAAVSRDAFDADAPCRLLVVAEREATSPEKLFERARAQLARGDAEWSTPDGIFFGSGACAGGLAILFPGQGSQRTGMLRDLACRFPQMLDALQTADDSSLNERLSDRIYPQPTFDAALAEADEHALRDTAVAQPAIGAVSLGAWRVLQHFGVSADAAGGHSFGELTALCAAGRLDAKSLQTLAATRGRLMADRNGGSDRGAMLALRMTAEEAATALDEESLDLVIANRNAPTQVVLSGATHAIDRAELALRARGIESRRLPVSAAFHSTLVADAAVPFRLALDSIEFHEATMPVYANTTGDPYPADASAARELLAHQLARPVDFVRQIRAMYDADVRTFVEVGPGATLTSLVGAILETETSGRALAIDASSGKRSGMTDLARALAQLAARGHTVDLTRWDTEILSPTSEAPSTAKTGKSGKAGKSLSFAVGGANIRTRKNHTMDRPAKQTRPAPGSPAPGSPVIGPQHAPLIDALRITQDNMLALSRLQEQTARLHQQFLEGQAASQHQLHTLIQQQQNLLSVSVGVASVGVPVLPAAPIVAAPALPAPAPIAPLAPIASSPPIPTPVPLPAPVPAPVVQERAPLNGSAPAPIPAVTARSTGNQDIGTVLLEIVAEKTGYPQDILELDMELDADLGIDSIKRVEILSAMQERLPNAPTVQPDQLGRLRTLREITEYLGDGDSAPAAAQKSAEEEPQAVPQAGDPVAQPRLEAFELTAKLEATGPRVAVGVKPGTAFWITDDDSKLAPALATALGARGIEAKVVGPRRPGAVPTELGGLVILAPAAGMDDAALKSAWRMAKRAGPALGRAAKNSANKTAAIFATVSRLDGGFGLLGGQLADPLSGGLAGLAKSASHEWPAVQCRALDRAPDWLDIDEVANALADELLATGPAEVGVSPDGRRVLELRSRTFEADSSSRPLRENDLVVVTGGARGVTAGACLALARACKPRLLILGRSEVPSEEPEWSRGLADAAAIQKAVLQRADTKLTPRELKAAVQRCLANREIRDNLRALRDAGAQVTYRATDVRDAAAVREAIASETGPVRGVIHGAGVLADQLILDKTAESFDRVFDTKVGGLRHVLAALDPQELRALILFSSSTARFGRKGQVDYAMANEVLNKMALAAAARYPDCRVLSLNWGPWAGGMVDASLRGVFQKEGVSLIPLEAGADYLVRELTSAHVAVETVVLGPRSRAPTAPPSELPLVVEHEIDIEKHAFLKSHVIDGRAVLPMAMTQEWLAHAAAHANPGLPFLGVDGLQVLRGVVLSGKSLRLRIHADKARKEGELYRVRVELRGDHDTLHARAEVLLGREDAPAPATDPAELTEFDETRSLYGDLLFHGPHFQSVETVDGWSKEGLTATVKTAPQPNEWMDAPLRRRFFTDPLAVDAAFQLAILWTRRFLGSPSLPTKIGAYRQFGVFKKATVRVVGWVRESTESMLRADFEFRAEDGTVIARLLDYACAIDGALENAFARNRLPAKPAQP